MHALNVLFLYLIGQLSLFRAVKPDTEFPCAVGNISSFGSSQYVTSRRISFVFDRIILVTGFVAHLSELESRHARVDE